MENVLALDGVVRDYAWGSTSAIQTMLGVEPDGRPAAELWLGAHPDDPARVADHDTTLDKIIAADPTGTLGPAVVERFDGRLPFLLKVLAADKALSLQVHPTVEQAVAGYALEEARGIPLDAPERNYRDTNHKPELLCALTPFDALCGFRPVADTLRLLDVLAVPALAMVRDLLAADGRGTSHSQAEAGGEGLRAAFTHLLTLPDPVPLVAAVVSAAEGLDGEWAGVARAVALTAGDFPGDVGIVLGLLLNHVRLEPGEAIYLAAGNVHAYLRGTGVEIMANSDNVLRCGLTPKHVDIPALLKITDFTELPEPRWPATVDALGVEFAVPVPDFALHVIDVNGGQSTGVRLAGPSIVLCTSGTVAVEAGGTTVDLAPARAAFISADEPFTLSGKGKLFVAGVDSAS